MTDSRRISEKAEKASNLPLDERIAYFRRKKWFGYHMAETILFELEDLLEYPVSDRMPNLLIAGDTNNGKTSLVKEFISKYPPDDNVEGSSITLPVFYMQAPPVPDEGRFYDKILDLLFAPYRTTDKIGKKEKEVIRLLKLVNVRMLIIDEIHNLLAGAMTKQRAMLNTIKNLGNSLGIPIVAVGTKDAFQALHSDDQLANRFERFVLPKWEINEEFHRLLASFEYTLALKEPSYFNSRKMAMELHRMSEGLLGELSTIITRAAVYAVRNDKECIDLNTLRSIQWTLPSKRKYLLK